MKLSASNIAWSAEQDDRFCRLMRDLGFIGLEIAPTRWFPREPYSHCAEAALMARQLREKYGLCISSMQSIWYGRTENIAASAGERQTLLAYTAEALRFANAVGCRNLVFGCPKNRAVRQAEQAETVIEFLEEAAALAEKLGIVIALEPNPPIYQTNFANTTPEALAIVRRISSPGLMVNLDFGTLAENRESPDIPAEDLCSVHHVHVSEPMLRPVVRRPEHDALRRALERSGYDGFVSLEMGNPGSPEPAEQALRDLAEVFS